MVAPFPLASTIASPISSYFNGCLLNNFKMLNKHQNTFKLSFLVASENPQVGWSGSRKPEENCRLVSFSVFLCPGRLWGVPHSLQNNTLETTPSMVTLLFLILDLSPCKVAPVLSFNSCWFLSLLGTVLRLRYLCIRLPNYCSFLQFPFALWHEHAHQTSQASVSLVGDKNSHLG